MTVRWTPEQHSYVQDNYPFMENQELADIMGCNYSKIIRYATQNGLRKNKPTIEEHDAYLLSRNLKRLEDFVFVNDRIKFECLKCGYGKNGEYVTSMQNALNRKDCIECQKVNREKQGKESKAWKGYGDISKRFINAVARGARGREIFFDITIEYMWDLFLKQNRKCALSGVELYFVNGPRHIYSKTTASLDRIDSSVGYIEGNVQWVHKKVNIMKHVTSQDEFIEWCRKIANHHDKSPTG